VFKFIGAATVTTNFPLGINKVSIYLSHTHTHLAIMADSKCVMI